MQAFDGKRFDEMVRQAWTEALPDTAFDAGSTWEEAGGDSLRCVMLVFHLEEALGAPLPFDVVSPATTPNQLANALAFEQVAPVRPPRALGRPRLEVVRSPR